MPSRLPYRSNKSQQRLFTSYSLLSELQQPSLGHSRSLVIADALRRNPSCPRPRHSCTDSRRPTWTTSHLRLKPTPSTTACRRGVMMTDRYSPAPGPARANCTSTTTLRSSPSQPKQIELLYTSIRRVGRLTFTRANSVSEHKRLTYHYSALERYT